MTDTRVHKINNAIKWSALSEIAAKLISPLTTAALARLLAPAAFGMVATIMIAVSFSEVLADAGFQKYIVQHECGQGETMDAYINVAFWTNLALSAFLYALIVIFRKPIANLLGNTGICAGLCIASLSILIQAMMSIQLACLRRKLEFKKLFRVRLAGALSNLCITVPLAYLLRNYWALIFGSLGSLLCTCVIAWAQNAWRPKFAYSRDHLERMFDFSLWSLLESVAVWLTNYAGTFIIGNYFSDYYVGVYKTSITTVSAVMALINSAFATVMFSSLSRLQNEDSAFQTEYYRFQRLFSYIVIPLGAGMLLYRALCVDILLGSQWGDAVFFLGIYSLAMALCIVFAQNLTVVFRSKGNPRLILICQLLYLIVEIILMTLGAKKGFDWLCIATVVSATAYVMICQLAARITYRMSLPRLLKELRAPIISTVVMSGAAVLLQAWRISIVRDIAAAAFCALVYCACLLLFRSVRSELAEYVATRRG